MRIGDVAMSVGFDRPQFLLDLAGGYVSDAVVKDGPRSIGEVVVFDAPDFLASARLVTIGRLGPDAEQLRSPANGPYQWRAMGFAEVTVFGIGSGGIFVV